MAGGQFEIEGALWLEPDVNIAGGEALVRHILKGVHYHQRTFGVRPRLMWLPDTFGYSAALPQLMALAGLDKHQELARMAVEETGRGVYEDKVIKNHYASEYIYHAYRNTKTVGVIEQDDAFGIHHFLWRFGPDHLNACVAGNRMHGLRHRAQVAHAVIDHGYCFCCHFRKLQTIQDHKTL